MSSTRERNLAGRHSPTRGQTTHAGLLLLLCLSFLAVDRAHAAERLDFRNPAAVFTNVAERLLRSEFGLSLAHIQLYPTNQYTPELSNSTTPPAERRPANRGRVIS